jgi:hypothetical protein
MRGAAGVAALAPFMEPAGKTRQSLQPCCRDYLIVLHDSVAPLIVRDVLPRASPFSGDKPATIELTSTRSQGEAATGDR